MNLLGIIVSFIFVFLIIGTSTILTNKKIINGEGSRKFIHIGVSNWWIIAMIFFKNPIWASIVPSIFIIINYISYKKQIFKAMERGKNKNDLGTVYYAISLLIISILSFSGIIEKYSGAIGIFIMGYGDGFAAIIGKKYSKKYFKILNTEKSIEGSLTMFIISFIITIIFSSISAQNNIIITSLLIATISTIIEILSPFGIDNLTVPIIISITYEILTNIIK